MPTNSTGSFEIKSVKSLQILQRILKFSLTKFALVFTKWPLRSKVAYVQWLGEEALTFLLNLNIFPNPVSPAVLCAVLCVMLHFMVCRKKLVS